MASFVDGIEFLVRAMTVKKCTVDPAPSPSESAATAMCYTGFAFVWVVVCGKWSSLDFSLILTAAAAVQCLGFLLLNVKVRSSRSVAGLSSGMLVLFVAHLCTRLCSTSLKSGYIPRDRSGDWAYQVFDAGTLGLVLHLLYRMHKTYKATYQAESDTFPVGPIVVGCFVLGAFVHGSFNKSIFFDTVWSTSSNLETFVLLPQLWMMAKLGGVVDGVHAHFVACVVASSVMTFTFWWYTGSELNKRGPCLASKVIIATHALKIVLSADFMYYYTEALLGGRSVRLPDPELMDV